MSDVPPTPAADRRAASADLVTAVALLALGIAMAVGGWEMDRLEVRRIHPASIPGLLPMILGASLAVCSLVLLAGAVRAGGHRMGWLGPLEGAPMDGLGRLAVAVALCLGYPIVLVGNMPFWLATAIFVTLFIALFELRSRTTVGHLRALATAAVQGVIVAVVVALTFQELFLVRLP